MASVAKKRKMNFSEREVEIIVEEIEKQKHTLVNHFNAGVTHMAKNNAWMDILKKVNQVTTCPRELPEVKKKWSDMKTEVRRKVAQARAAIEGTSADCTPVPVILTAMQQRICNLLGEATIISLPAGDSPQELKSRIALNSARLLQEQRVTNVHIRQIAQHLEGQNELLQMMRRSQEAQAFAQERQAQALEGTQAALLALVQMLRPALKDLRKFLQSGSEAANASSSVATPATGATIDGVATEEQSRPKTPPPPTPTQQAEEAQ
uniref:Nuclear apoptosis inducing factor 1 n=1 Tax=Neolamprologus brichardi TaxID=32507 RepID=A0A3Q4GAH2_NEOBR